LFAAHHDHGVAHKKSMLLPLKVALFFAVSFFAAELAAGLLSGSLAVLGDSFHNLSHAFVLVFSIFGLALAVKPPTKKMTYGLRRLESLVPAANAIFLAIVGAWLIMEGRYRLLSNQEVSGIPIIAVSSLDIVSNVFVAALMKKYWRNLTVKTIMAHLVFDALASLGVIFGGISIALWNFYRGDALAAIFIGGLTIVSSGIMLWKISYAGLMEGVPAIISYDEIETFLLKHKEVLMIEDMHIWNVGEKNYITVHLILRSTLLRAVCELDEFVEELSRGLKHEFQISHVTIQPEFRIMKPEEH